MKLLEDRQLSPGRRLYLERHVVPPAGQDGNPAENNPIENQPGASEGSGATSSEERTVRGKTSFQELLDWGLSQATIEEILGKPVADLGGTVKDFCTANGVNFETIKPALQAAADQLE